MRRRWRPRESRNGRAAVGGGGDERIGVCVEAKVEVAVGVEIELEVDEE